MEHYTHFRETVAGSVDTVVQQYLSCCTNGQGLCHIDPAKYKFVKRKQHVRCYRPTSDYKALRAPGEVLATGETPGTVDDLLYGCVNLTDETMRLDSDLVKGSDLMDCRVLATLEAPSTQDPFRSLAVKWLLRKYSSISQPRDYVYLEATGTTTVASDDGGGPIRIGYQVVQSIDFASAPSFSRNAHIVRGHMHSCLLFRQRPGRDVELFFLGSVDPQGGLKEKVGATIAMDLVSTSSRHFDSAQMKKLTYVVRSRCFRTIEAEEEEKRREYALFKSSSSTRPSLHIRHTPIACVVCDRSLRLHSKSKCRSCGATAVCSRCRVYKHVLVSNEDVERLKLEFCTECIGASEALDAAHVATRELQMLSGDMPTGRRTVRTTSGAKDVTRRRVKSAESLAEDEANRTRDGFAKLTKSLPTRTRSYTDVTRRMPLLSSKEAKEALPAEATIVFDKMDDDCPILEMTPELEDDVLVHVDLLCMPSVVEES